MKKGSIHLLRRMGILMIPLVIISVVSALLISHDPMKYYKEGYSCYLQNKLVSGSKDSNYRVLICGDSTAKTDWLPASLSEDTYNFSLGGVSPVEEYYYIRDYLQNNEIPEYIIYSMSISHYMEAGSFWQESVYFHTLDIEDLLDVLVTKRSFRESSLWGDKGLLDIIGYYTYSPVLYGTALVEGTLHDRSKFNIDMYNEVINNKGQYCYNKDKNVEKRIDDSLACSAFTPDPLIDYYFRKTIELCEDNGIRFVYQLSPINASTYSIVSPDVVEQWYDYLDDIRMEYQNANFDGELIIYSDELFSDPTHLSPDGVASFSAEMRERYAYIFDR